MPSEKTKGVDAKLPLMQHLIELRKRLIRVFIIVIIVFCVVYSKSAWFMDFVTAPVIKVLPPHSSLSLLKLTEGFFTEMKLSFVVAIFFSSPAIFYQLWKFVAPGLYAQEKKYIISFVISASGLFISGAAFAYYMVFPYAFQFFLTYAHGAVTANLSLAEYLSFFTNMLLAFGLVFEMPIFTLFLAKMGIVTAEMMRKYRRYSYLGIVIIAGIITPTPDIMSQLMMSGPMVILYELSIFIAKAFGRKKRIKEEDVYE